MCFSSPDIKDPVAPQEAKTPDFADLQKARKTAALGAGGSTLLTGPSGLSQASGQSFGSSTLLGQ